MKKRWTKSLLPLIFLHLTLTCLIAQHSFSQSLVTEKKSLEQYVRENLIGKGVKVSNIKFNGDPLAISAFSKGGETNLGINNGVLITTGLAYDTLGIGPQGPNTRTNASYDNTGKNNPFLDQLLSNGALTYDAAILEFDFIPSGDTIRMKYIFASEEYPEFVCSKYNDIFGFFITGPDPFGGVYSDSNFAKIPGKDLPVAINSVNSGTEGGNTGGIQNCYDGEGLLNANYFIDNCNGCKDPSTTIQYDGFSIPMEIVIPVECSKKYTFKIMIADVSDYQFDSGVFLEAKSFSGNISDPIVDAAGTTICSGQSTTLKAIAPGGPYYWYKEAYGGIPIHTGDKLVTSVLFKDTTFYVERTDKGCVSDRIPVKVIVNKGPDVNIKDQASCGYTIDITQGVTTSETNVSYHFTLTDAEKDINPIADPTKVIAGIYYVRVESNSSCITILPIKASLVGNPDLSTKDLSYCEPLSSLDLTAGVTTNGTTIHFYLSLTDAQNDINRITNPKKVLPGKYFVRSELAGGCYTIDSLNAIINPRPTISTKDQFSCAPMNKIDLTKGYTTNGESTTFHETLADANNKTGTIHNPDNVDPGTYFVRSEFSGTGCFNVVPIKAFIEPEPKLIVTDQFKCAPATIFDLTAGVKTDGGNSIDYFLNLNDAENGNNPMANPSSVSAGNYFVKVQSAKGCSKIKVIKAAEKTAPSIQTKNLAVCEPENLFDLNTGVTTDGITTNFFNSLSDANNNTNPIANSTNAPQGKYYVRSEFASDCYGIDSFETVVNKIPELKVSNIEKCAPQLIFDLNEGIIKNNGGSLNFYTSEKDAEDQKNEIKLPKKVQLGKYFVRSNSPNGCHKMDSFSTIENPMPELATTHLDICFPVTGANLNDGISSNASKVNFYFSLKDAKSGSTPIQNSSNAPKGKYYVAASTGKGCTIIDSLEVREANSELTVTNLEVCSPVSSFDLETGVKGNGIITYHDDILDAELGSNPIANPNKVSEGSYFVRNNSGGCIAVKPLIAKVNPIPQMDLNDSWSCEPNFVNLTLGTTSKPYSLSFYNNENDATNKMNPINNPKAVNEGIYYARGEYQTGCFAIESIKASIFPLPELTTKDQHVCNPKKVNLMYGLYSNGNVTFHYSLSDAEKGSNPIPDPTTVDAGLYHARSVSNIGCITTDSIRAVIEDAPVLDITNQQACEPNLVDLTQGVATSGNDLNIVFYSTVKDALNQKNALSNPKEVNSGEFFVRVQSLYGCSSIGKIEANINSLPEAPVVKDALICFNDKAYLSVEDPNGIYNWYDSPYSSNMLATSSTFITPNLSQNTTYYIEQMDATTLCASSKTSVVVSVTDTLPGPIMITPAICKGDSGSILASGPKGPYNWYRNIHDEIPFFVGNQLHLSHPNGKAVYYVEIAGNASCPSKRTAVKPMVIDLPEANFSVHQENEESGGIFVQDLSKDAVQGIWKMGDGNNLDYIPHTNFDYQYTTTPNSMNGYEITLIVENNHHCKDTAIHKITINSNWSISFPNAFTPNGDLLNDTFFGKGIGIEEFDLTIFNRWGELVFHSKNISEQWDGRNRKGTGNILPSGMYVWKAKIKDVYNSNHLLTGHLLLEK